MLNEQPNINNESSEEFKYLGLGSRVLSNGVMSSNRTINNTKKLFGSQLRFDLSMDTIPLLTSKYVNFKAVVAELVWFCRGSTGNNLLKELGTGIWNEWANEKGQLGPVYGAMWRRKPISLGAVGQTVNVSDLQEKHKRTDDIIEVEQEAIESVAELNKDWKDNKQKYPHEFNAWINMLGFCSSRFITSVTSGQEQAISVTKDFVGTYEERLAWIEGLKDNTVWSEINTDIFSAAQPSDIYKPWLSFENFLRDIPSIAYNESRGDGACRITSYFHGVKFYSPQTTAFYVPVLQYIAKDFMQKATPEELQNLRPKIVVDQLHDLIETLKSNPFSRRMVVNSWEPSFIPDEGDKPNDNPSKGLQALTPCHHDWQVCVRSVTVGELLSMDLLATTDHYVSNDNDNDTSGELFEDLFADVNKAREEQGLEPLQRLTLDLRFSMRSTDVFLGLPFNLASYAVLARVLAKIAGMNAGELVFQGTDVHLYENTFEQMREQLHREVKEFPILKLTDIKSIDDFNPQCLTLCDYAHSGVIKAEVSV